VGVRDIPLEDEIAFIPFISLGIPKDGHGAFFDYGVTSHQPCYQGDIHFGSKFNMRD